MQVSAAFIGQNSPAGIPQGLSGLEKICQVFSQKAFLFLPAERVREVLNVVNDERVFHGVTPIVQLDVTKPAWRDVLVVTYKRKR
jgi:hypothetical protein